jgi:hypothetical protein
MPAGNMAECTPIGAAGGNLCGICPDCERLIYRRVNLTKIDVIRGELEITFTQPSARIRESAVLSVNSDSRQKGQAHENP